MNGYQVARMEDVVETADIFVTATGCFEIITAERMAAMKNKAIVGNIGHFDNEIDMAGLAKIPGIIKTEIKPQVHGRSLLLPMVRFAASSCCRMVVCSNLVNTTGYPSFVMSNSFANQTMALDRAVDQAR